MPKGQKLITVGITSADTVEASIKAVLSGAEYRFLKERMATWYSHIAGRYDAVRVLQVLLRGGRAAATE